MAFSIRSRSSTRVGRTYTWSNRTPRREAGIHDGVDFRPQFDRWASIRDSGFFDWPTTPSLSRAYTAGFKMGLTSMNPSSTGSVSYSHLRFSPIPPRKSSGSCVCFICMIRFLSTGYPTPLPQRERQNFGPTPARRTMPVEWGQAEGRRAGQALTARRVSFALTNASMVGLAASRRSI